MFCHVYGAILLLCFFAGLFQCCLFAKRRHQALDLRPELCNHVLITDANTLFSCRFWWGSTIQFIRKLYNQKLMHLDGNSVQSIRSFWLSNLYLPSEKDLPWFGGSLLLSPLLCWSSEAEGALHWPFRVYLLYKIIKNYNYGIRKIYHPCPGFLCYCLFYISKYILYNVEGVTQVVQSDWISLFLCPIFHHRKFTLLFIISFIVSISVLILPFRHT